MSDQDLTKIEDAVLLLIERAHSRHGSIPEPDGYISPGLAAIDAVFSANSRYSSVINVMHRIVPKLSDSFGGDNCPELTLSRLKGEYEDGYSPVIATKAETMARDFYENRSVIGDVRKALVIYNLAARVMTSHTRIAELEEPLDTYQAFTNMWGASNALGIGEKVATDLMSVRGIGPATSRYFLLLLGGPFVKPDRMTERYVALILGRNTSKEETCHLLESAIQNLRLRGMHRYSTPRVDHLIWQVMSRRLDV